MKRKLIIAVLSCLLILSLTACSQTDVVGKYAKTSFAQVIEAIPDQIEADEQNGGWSLNAPDGSARFIWSEDFSKTPLHDVMIEVDAKPFLDAGLDASKLPAGILVGDKIMLGTDLGDESANLSESTPKAAFDQIVSLHRSAIGYHLALDHYGVDLSGGNKFEWAKDMEKNDKDIVFVIDPEIFIAAGVDPNKVEGWAYASVKVMDESGKPIEVMKLLKPFDIK